MSVKYWEPAKWTAKLRENRITTFSCSKLTWVQDMVAHPGVTRALKSLRVCLCYRPIRFDFDMSPKLSDRREQVLHSKYRLGSVLLVSAIALLSFLITSCAFPVLHKMIFLGISLDF